MAGSLDAWIDGLFDAEQTAGSDCLLTLNVFSLNVLSMNRMEDKALLILHPVHVYSGRGQDGSWKVWCACVYVY